MLVKNRMVSMDEIEPEVFYRLGKAILSDTFKGISEYDFEDKDIVASNKEEPIKKQKSFNKFDFHLEILNKEKIDCELHYNIINKANKKIKDKIEKYLEQKNTIKTELKCVLNEEIENYNNNCKKLNNIIERIHIIENMSKHVIHYI